jgi:SAM-dependent methyltransferase
VTQRSGHLPSPVVTKRRPQLAPWRMAGRASEDQPTADEVVRETGWVFNNETGQRLTLEEFVATGSEEVGWYCHHLGLFWGTSAAGRTFVEIGSGIGRMTAALTRHYHRVIACDLDAAFLERCRETVALHGVVEHLQTSHVADGRSLVLPSESADVVFSYITLQHCNRSDALDLVREALRVVRPGGRVALNFRTWTAKDVVLVPIGWLVRLVWRVVPRLAKAPRLVTRFGWQANRLTPNDVLPVVDEARPDAAMVMVFQSSRRRRPIPSPIPVQRLEGAHPGHWWLVVQR